ncbi:MAG: DUF1573 domain-containing protein [Planctomycetia bacterium]|nr:DUF1573 domain-containing protein [Planctomycetia bacterium]
MKHITATPIFSMLVACLLTLTHASSLLGQTQSNQWALKMFSELGTEYVHDFGSVALHANVEHHFQFRNIYQEDVVISSVSSNCGCTKASVSKQVIRSGEIGEVIARVDTSGREHTKQRRATIRVQFSQPRVTEVQLQVKTYIRPDVGFDPGAIEFGTVQHGTSMVKKAYLQYEGRPDWALIGIQKTNPGIRAEAREVKRQGGSIVYEIYVELKSDAHAGYIQDLLKFQTNDRDAATASIFLPIQALVVEPLCAKPSYLQLGVVSQGESLSKNLVISGSTPFKILDIQSTDGRLDFIKTNLVRTVHIVPVTFHADNTIGEFNSAITITIAEGENTTTRKTQKIRVETVGNVVNLDSLLKKGAQESTRKIITVEEDELLELDEEDELLDETLLVDDDLDKPLPMQVTSTLRTDEADDEPMLNLEEAEPIAPTPSKSKAVAHTNDPKIERVISESSWKKSNRVEKVAYDVPVPSKTPALNNVDNWQSAPSPKTIY